MKPSSQFCIRGSVTKAERQVTLSGKQLARLYLLVPSFSPDGKDDIFRVDFYGAGTIPRVLALEPRTPVLVHGRISGRISDRGYFNASLFGDAVYIAPASALAETNNDTPPPSNEADEDIPF